MGRRLEWPARDALCRPIRSADRWPFLARPRALSRTDGTFANRALDLSSQAGISPQLEDLNGDGLFELVFVDARIVILTQALFADGFED